MTERELFYKDKSVSVSENNHQLSLFTDCKQYSKKNSCFLCGSRRQRNLRLQTVGHYPAHLAGFPEPEPNGYILTLVCISCSKFGGVNDE